MKTLSSTKVELKKRRCLLKKTCTKLIIMKMKMENRSHRCDIDRSKPKHGHKYDNYDTNYSVSV